MTKTKLTNKGKIKFFNEAKGYGFLFDYSDEKEIFFHVSGLANGKVQKDDEVEFNLETGDRGLKAILITKVPGLKTA
jgi:CspA family cold shock protein